MHTTSEPSKHFSKWGQLPLKKSSVKRERRMLGCGRRRREKLWEVININCLVQMQFSYFSSSPPPTHPQRDTFYPLSLSLSLSSSARVMSKFFFYISFSVLNCFVCNINKFEMNKMRITGCNTRMLVLFRQQYPFDVKCKMVSLVLRTQKSPSR